MLEHITSEKLKVEVDGQIVEMTRDELKDFLKTKNVKTAKLTDKPNNKNEKNAKDKKPKAQKNQENQEEQIEEKVEVESEPETSTEE